MLVITRIIKKPQLTQILSSVPTTMKPKLPTTPKTGQRTLDTFLKKSDSVKRKTGNENECKMEQTPVKRSKVEENGRTVLSPEVKKKISDNQTLARLKLLSHTLTLIDPPSIGPSWYTEILETEFKKPYFKTLDSFYSNACRSATVYPPRDKIFSWTKYCELRDVKVVIIGQDPYHGVGQAHGLCFSVQKGVAVPPSLQNMYKELKDDPGVEGFTEVPRHGCLVGWAEQGVLLLNAVLTVEASKANSHKGKGWEDLTSAVIKWISRNMRNVVFLLWGANAIKIGGLVDRERHHVLQSVHPSPLSAHRGFLGCRHFSKCNEFLVGKGIEPVRWEELP